MRVAKIVVLGIAVVAGGVAAILANRSPEPTAAPPPPPVAIDTVKILVATRDISTGQVISAQDMDWRNWPKASTSPQDVLETVQQNAKNLYEGDLARVPIQSGWPVRASNLIDARVKISSAGYMAATLPPGKRAVSIDISVETGAGGAILPNDRVDVIHTHKDREDRRANAESFVSDTLLSNIPVRAIDQTFEERNGVRTVVGKTATLELTPAQAEELATARQDGRLSLSLRSLEDSKGSSPVAGRRTVVNICRRLVCEPNRFRPDDGTLEGPARSASN